MEIRYLGHACFQVETKGKQILIDPFISENPLAKDLDIDKIEADYILVTHGHGDHILDVSSIAKRNAATIVSNFEIADWFGKQGFQWHPMNFGGAREFEFGMLKYVYAAHSSTLPDGSNGGNPGGFVLWNDEGCIYFAGDTSLTMDMQLIPMTCPDLSLAVLPIGDNFTMNYQDAVIAARFVKCNRIVGCHYDTFDLIKIDQQAAIAAFTDDGKELILMDIGNSMEV